MRRHLILLVFGLIPAGLTLPAVAADATESILGPCVACHGTDGVAKQRSVPHIDGQQQDYLSDAMRAFAQDTRKTAVEAHRRMPAADVKLMAAHYASRKITRPRPVTDPALVARGEALYNNRCADCHMDNGRESDKDAPLMAAQDLDYLIRQTAAYRGGARRFPTMMDDAYRGLSEADLASVAHFFASQDPLVPAAGGRKRRK